jgi:hypothetical protein
MDTELPLTGFHLKHFLRKNPTAQNQQEKTRTITIVVFQAKF